MGNRVVAVFVATGVAALCAVSPALASFPGQNGKIAFSSDRDGDTEIYTMNADGTSPTPLTANTIADADPAWSPDGTRIAFEHAGAFFTEIWVMNANGAGQVQVYPQGTDPTWSPDGTRIAFAQNSGIAVVNADGTGFQELTPSAAPGFEANIDSEPAWSPDGATILFARFGDVQGGAEPEKIYAMNPDGTGVHQVTPDITFGEANNTDTGPEWAPGGPQFAYSRVVDDQDFFHGLQITTPADPYDYTTLTPAGGHPAWSPDASTIAFELGHDIHAIPATGGTAVNLTNVAGNDRNPNWQPIPVNGYPRPRGATPLHVALVPAYTECTAPNRTHGPPLGFDSCSAPQQTSTQLTVGTFDANSRTANSKGSVRLDVVLGDPATPADEADLGLEAMVTDVRNAGTLSDYAGNLSAEMGVRIIDKDNTPNPGGPGAATVSDFSFGLDVPCYVTADANVGSTCTVTTTADALLGEAAKERKRMIWQLGAVEVRDANGGLFMTQGVFVP